MKFAIVHGQREEAQPTLAGVCPGCGAPMLAKCGEVNVRHWAHKGRRDCDPWWENETEWHRAWKDHFPIAWQEIVHHADDGERHIADVKTDEGWVIEFQHSLLTPKERRSREAFYPKLLWVLDGTRRKRDRAQLVSAWEVGLPFVRHSRLRRVSSDDCRALREWAGSSAPIFYDLGDAEALWYVLAKTCKESTYVYPLSRAQFIDWHRAPFTEASRKLDEFVTALPKVIGAFESRPRAESLGWDPLQLRRPRKRFRF